MTSKTLHKTSCVFINKHESCSVESLYFAVNNFEELPFLKSPNQKKCHKKKKVYCLEVGVIKAHVFWMRVTKPIEINNNYTCNIIRTLFT